MRSALVRRSRRGAEAWRACSRWEPHSYGYHGDDGKKFHNHGQGHDYGPTYSTGDVIGAGVHLERQEIFFTCAPSPANPCRLQVLVLFKQRNPQMHACAQGPSASSCRQQELFLPKQLSYRARACA